MSKNGKEKLQYQLARRGANVHFEIEINHRRAAEVPSEAAEHGAAPRNLVLDQGADVVDGIGEAALECNQLTPVDGKLSGDAVPTHARRGVDRFGATDQHLLRI